MKKIAVILAGCGNRDGSETHETLSVLLAIDKRGIEYQCFAPNGEFDVFNHIEGKANGEKRTILLEASRLCRGNIKPLSMYKNEDYDALIIPGGMGAAQNLSNYAFVGKDITVNQEVEKAILETYSANKPIGALCIAPMLLAKVLGDENPTLTLGNDCPAAQDAIFLGCNHQICKSNEVAVDVKHKIVTTPAYMVATHISEIFEGSDNLVEELCKL
ncbi:MAG: isoprenoid biosynthesis glyoxalase ElbB [Bacteroidales bacterium]|nr:isoprenoid biosynthesis glyoxalase ElbB [Bacteroidales bacterium]